MKTVICIVIVLTSVAGKAYATAGPVDSVLDRYRQFLFQTTEIPDGRVSHLVETLRSDGRWPGIDYEDQARADWKTLYHLKKVDTLSIAWSNPNSSFYHREDVWQAVERSLNDWLRHRYQNPNWWHNQIGVPQVMRDILILVRQRLSPGQFDTALAVVGQLKVQGTGAGANLTWSADLGFYYGALKGDTVLMNRCRELILKEIHIGTGEGVQPDYSFHQHHARLQMYQYGKAFLFANIRLAWGMVGTPWAFPESKVKILTDFLLKGWQWMARGVNTVPGTMDRSSSRVGELKSPDIRFLVPMLCELEPDEARAFRKIKVHQNSDGSLSGFRYYPYSDFAAYQTPDFSYFLKMISTRTLSSEVGLNSENLRGKLLNSGNGYLVRDGNEYYDMMPVWNWEELPGITAFHGAEKIIKEPFVGSVSDGESGLTAMDYRMQGVTADEWLKAHKIWACHDGLIVCLIAGLQTHHLSGYVYTVMDQSRLESAVVVGRPIRQLSRGLDTMTNVPWIYHDRFVYLPLGQSRIALKADSTWGRWSDINRSISADLIKDSVFLPVLLRQASAENASFGYVLSYRKNLKQVEQLYRKPTWNILKNDSVSQVILFKDKTLMAAFFSPGRLKWGQRNLSIDRPCLIMVSGRRVFVSDPTHQGGVIHLILDDQTLDIILRADGTTAERSL